MSLRSTSMEDLPTVMGKVGEIAQATEFLIRYKAPGEQQSDSPPVVIEPLAVQARLNEPDEQVLQKIHCAARNALRSRGVRSGEVLMLDHLGNLNVYPLCLDTLQLTMEVSPAPTSQPECLPGHYLG